MDIAKFLALPGALTIKMRIGPHLDDVVDVDQQYFESHRDELHEFCRPRAGRQVLLLLRQAHGTCGLSYARPHRSRGRAGHVPRVR